MHMVVVGGGPTGVEYAGELHDFLIVSGSNGYAPCCIANPRTICASGTRRSRTD